jgi:superfamily II DNA or RNA helicase
MYAIWTKEEFKKHLNGIPGYDAVVIDEAHYVSGIKSQLYKSVMTYMERHIPRYRYLLTATPYMSTPWNIYAIANILGRNWKYIKFKNYFFYSVKMGNKMVPMPKPGMEGEIAKLVKSLGSVVKMEECVDVPEGVHQCEYFELTGEQKECISGLEEWASIVEYAKFHRICGGTYKDYEGNIVYLESEKLERVMDLIEQYAKLVVVCRYRSEIEMIRSKVKKSCYVIHGDIKDRDSVIGEANESDNCVIILQAACSEGYNLPTFNQMVFYSMDFSLKNYEQIMGRILRINNPQKCVYRYFIVDKSIDSGVYQSMMRKQDFNIAIYFKEKYERNKN